ncbi:MAG TPA: protein translocase subunit SecD [Dehalococcoidia bacterium]|nr:protein translocase subunit SecD [Dehalococcoidia bacterium]
MRRRSTQLALAFIAILTVFSVLVVWPSDPDRYLPDFVPWPEPGCVGPVCIGKGVRLPYIAIDRSTIRIDYLERREMRLGLDLRGGTRLVLEADISRNPDVDLDEALDSAVEVVERRVNAFGVAESITERVGNNRISVQLPGISAAEAIEKIGRTAQLQFMEMRRDAQGNVVIRNPDGSTSSMPFDQVSQSSSLIQLAEWTPVTAVGSDGIRREITGTYLDRGGIFVTRNLAGLPELRFEMNEEGAKLLGEATARLSNPPQPMAFFLDGEPIRGANGLIIAPFVRSQISDRGVIDGLSLSEAETLSTLLRTGAFPVPLTVVQQEDVDATLGDEAVVHSVQAGLIAIFVVMAFMTLYYRLPGLLASLALFVYVSLTLAVFKLWPVTVTSAGIAAFVLSVGMAVDANILIFERMKEELRVGRSLVGAIDAGFNRAWTSIRDSNVATLIICVILYWFGDQFAASLVKGFALTLALGVAVSMFSAIFVTRTFLRALIGSNVMQHLWLFGHDVEEARGPRAAEAAVRVGGAGLD